MLPSPLSASHKEHLEAFAALRPSWRVSVVDPLFGGEFSGGDVERAYKTPHPYVRGMKDVLRVVNTYQPKNVLDIGSPLPQNIAVHYFTNLCVLDIRAHPDKSLGLTFLQGTATDIPLPTASQDMVTSCWVICHVGDGRYGDPLKPEGDLRMLEEVHRVLRPGGIFVLGIGPVDDTPYIVFNVHRVYSWAWLCETFELKRFKILEMGEYPVSGDMYLDPGWTSGAFVRATTLKEAYGFVVLEKL